MTRGDDSAIPNRLGTAMRHVSANEAITNAVRSGMTAAELRSNFADVALDTGTAEPIGFAGMLEGIPDTQTFNSTDELTDAMIENVIANSSPASIQGWKASALNESARGRTAASLLNSGVNSIQGVTPEFANVLKALGLSTISKLASANEENVMKALKAVALTT